MTLNDREPESIESTVCMLKVYRSDRWLYALINNSDKEIDIYNIELYWDGGEVTALNKREAIISLWKGDLAPSEKDHDRLFDLEFLKVDSNTDNIFYVFDESESITYLIDPDASKKYPIIMGKTELKPDMTIEPGEQLFIGAQSFVDGNITVSIKGHVYDTEEKRNKPELEIIK